MDLPDAEKDGSDRLARRMDQLVSGELLAVKNRSVTILQPVADSSVPVLFPGAFNPLHDGHRRMAAIAQQHLGHPVAFEISISNVDKQSIDTAAANRRAEQFSDGTLFFTNASRFTAKAQIFPGTTFVLGADTLLRLVDRRYYQNDDAARDGALETIVGCRCRFLLFGRVVAGRYVQPTPVDLPAVIRQRCDIVSQEQFRMDVSSSDLRSLQSEISRNPS